MERLTDAGWRVILGTICYIASPWNPTGLITLCFHHRSNIDCHTFHATVPCHFPPPTAPPPIPSPLPSSSLLPPQPPCPQSECPLTSELVLPHYTRHIDPCSCYIRTYYRCTLKVELALSHLGHCPSTQYAASEDPAMGRHLRSVYFPYNFACHPFNSL